MPFDIVVADDDPVVRHILSSLLRAGGHQVEEFTSGGALLQAFASRAQFPDILFLDLQLGDMTGAEVVPEIRRLAKEKTRIVILSANDREESKALFPEMEADDYLSKPFTPSQLQEVLSRL